MEPRSTHGVCPLCGGEGTLLQQGITADQIVVALYQAGIAPVDGQRDVMGMWVGPTGGEGAKQWMNMLTDLRNRGVLAACIVCCDGLRGLPRCDPPIWPRAEDQVCVVHLVRSSLRSSKKLVDHHRAEASDPHRPRPSTTDNHRPLSVAARRTAGEVWDLLARSTHCIITAVPASSSLTDYYPRVDGSVTFRYHRLRDRCREGWPSAEVAFGH